MKYLIYLFNQTNTATKNKPETNVYILINVTSIFNELLQ